MQISLLNWWKRKRVSVIGLRTTKPSMRETLWRGQKLRYYALFSKTLFPFHCLFLLLVKCIEFLLITESHILSCIDRLLGPLGKICGCHRLLYDWNWEVGQRSKFLWPWVTLASNSYVYFIWRTHLFVMLHSFFSCEMSCLLIKQMMYTADVC